MKLDNLIDTIKRALAIQSTRSVSVSESSTLIDIFHPTRLSTNPRPIFRGWPKLDRSHPYPATQWLKLAVKETPFFLLHGLYTLLDIIVAGTHYLHRGIAGIKKGERKHQPSYSNPRINIVVAGIITIILLAATVYTIIFIVNDIFFFRNETSTNQKGAIVTKMSLEREHIMYSFNTADLWANTGVTVLPGDKVQITASGAFYSALSDLYQSANDNITPEYRLTNMSYVDNDTVRRKYCIYRADDAILGSLLCRIADPNDRFEGYKSDAKNIIQLQSYKPQSDPLTEQSPQNGISWPHRLSYAMNWKWARPEKMQWREITVTTPGTLYFAVNDIYLDTATYHSMAQDKTHANIAKKVETVNTHNGTLPANPRQWFDDNVGDVMLNIVITRDLSNVHGLTILKKAYIKAYRFSRAIIDNPTVSILIATLTILLITALIALDHQYLYRPELRSDTNL